VDVEGRQLKYFVDILIHDFFRLFQADGRSTLRQIVFAPFRSQVLASSRAGLSSGNDSA